MASCTNLTPFLPGLLHLAAVTPVWVDTERPLAAAAEIAKIVNFFGKILLRSLRIEKLQKVAMKYFAPVPTCFHC